MASSPISPVVFVVGRPSSGKSTIIARLRSGLQRLLGSDFPVHVIDEFDGERLNRPQSLKAAKTKPMCVAEWRGWLEFGDEGKLDLEGSVKNIGVAKEVLLRTIRGSTR